MQLACLKPWYVSGSYTVMVLAWRESWLQRTLHWGPLGCHLGWRAAPASDGGRGIWLLQLAERWRLSWRRGCGHVTGWTSLRLPSGSDQSGLWSQSTLQEESVEEESVNKTFHGAQSRSACCGGRDKDDAQRHTIFRVLVKLCSQWREKDDISILLLPRYAEDLTNELQSLFFWDIWVCRGFLRCRNRKTTVRLWPHSCAFYRCKCKTTTLISMILTISWSLKSIKSQVRYVSINRQNETNNSIYGKSPDAVLQFYVYSVKDSLDLKTGMIKVKWAT